MLNLTADLGRGHERENTVVQDGENEAAAREAAGSGSAAGEAGQKGFQVGSWVNFR